MNSPIISSILGYVDQQRLPLVTKLNLGGKTAQTATIQTGVKQTAALNLLTTSIAFGDNKGCGFSADSEQTLSQRNLVVNNIKSETAYCIKALLQTWAGYQVRVNGKELPFEEQFFNDLIAKISEKADLWIWQGSTAVGAAVAAQTNGLITLALADANVHDVAIAAGTTKYAAIKQMVAAIPAAELQGEKRIYASPEFVMGYMMELVDLNLYHFEPGKDYDEIQIPGTSVILTAVVGLSNAATNLGHDYLFFANRANFFYGVDMEGDAESIDSWYSADTDTVRVRVAFNAGAQYAFGTGIVLGEIA